MKKHKLLCCAIFLVPFLPFSQLKLGGKGAVKEINLSIPQIDAVKINNSSDGEKTADFSKVTIPEGSEGEMSVTIVNPYNTKLLFAYATSDRMRAVEIESYSLWTGVAYDYWQNVVISTKGRQLAYMVKSNNCYTLYWEKGLGSWSIKPLKCGVYKK